MTVGQLREHLAGLPGDLEVHVQDPAAGRSITAESFSRYGACIVLEGLEDPDGDAPAGYHRAFGVGDPAPIIEERV